VIHNESRVNFTHSVQGVLHKNIWIKPKNIKLNYNLNFVQANIISKLDFKIFDDIEK